MEEQRIYVSINDAVKAVFGSGVTVAAKRGVSGGDINAASCAELSNGERVFIKSNRSKDVDFFVCESEGLEAIERTDTLRVPKVLAVGKDVQEGAFLMLAYVPSVHKNGDYWEALGEGLFAMHHADTKSLVPGGKYGFYKDNYIGARRQVNTPKDGWVDFFRECRLEPRVKETESYFDSDMRKRILTLFDRLDRWIAEPKVPSLLHGDLWGGNVLCGSDGSAWLIDPAAYVGAAEADLAMTELFGGFSGEFYRAYFARAGKEPGYEDRRELYNLYHLLNHLAMFGRSYYVSVERIVKRYTWL